MSLTRYFKAFINSLSIKQIYLLHKLFIFFIMIGLVIICQTLGLAEFFPTTYAITPHILENNSLNNFYINRRSELNSLDNSIPLGSENGLDNISLQESENRNYKNLCRAPLASEEDREVFSIQRSESHFYEEICSINIPSESEEYYASLRRVEINNNKILTLSDSPSPLPGCTNKQMFECIGLFVGVSAGLALRTYLFIFPASAVFDCSLYNRAVHTVSRFLRNLF
jgi:hypothetical protein